MATRLKTTEWYAGFRATLTDNTLQACNTVKLYLPEFSGTVTFKKVEVLVSWKSGAGCPLANLSSRRIDVSIAGAAATSYTNANLYTASGEDVDYFHAADCTAHFVANWTSGTNQNLIISVLADMLTSTPTYVDVEATIFLTYEYDDSQSTHIKTVYIPLNAPAGAMATSKPGVATDTIPALDTELPETSKTFRSMYIVAEGNIVAAAVATDGTLSMQIESYTAYASSSMEATALSDRWQRFVYGVKYYDGSGVAQGAGMDTSLTRNFYIWASVARHHHIQAYLVVTYEFDATGSTDAFISMLLPLNYIGMMGGTTSSDYCRTEVDFWIPEANIVAKQLAAFMFWEQVGAISTLQFRLGTGSFVTYTDVAATMCGSNGCMIRTDNAIALARGRNVLNVDAYRTDITDLGWGLNGYVIVNYTGDKPSGGYGACNHTVKYSSGIAFDGTSIASAAEKALAAWAPAIPETNYFLNNFGWELKLYTDTTGTLTSIESYLENTSGESGVQWLQMIKGYCISDPETGLHMMYANLTEYFKRYPTDPQINQYLYNVGLDIETTRRYWARIFGPSTWQKWNFLLTYHTVTYTVAGTITSCAAATPVDIYLLDVTTGRMLDSSVGNVPVAGSVTYSFTVYDQANNLIVAAYQDGTHCGASTRGVAA